MQQALDTHDDAALRDANVELEQALRAAGRYTGAAEGTDSADGAMDAEYTSAEAPREDKP